MCRWNFSDVTAVPQVLSFPLFLEVQGHLAKGQRTLAGDGMSQVTKNLLDLTQRRNFYAGDLLSSVEILRNVTETFKRASYEPSSDDVQVTQRTPNVGCFRTGRASWEKRRCVSETAHGPRPKAHGSGVSGDLLHVLSFFISSCWAWLQS